MRVRAVPGEDYRKQLERGKGGGPTVPNRGKGGGGRKTSASLSVKAPVRIFNRRLANSKRT